MADSPVTTFLAEQVVFLDGIDAATTEIATDMQSQADLIAQLQAAPGKFTDADQATVDTLQARQLVTLEKVKALAALVPPVVPVVPPGV